MQDTIESLIEKQNIYVALSRKYSEEPKKKLEYEYEVAKLQKKIFDKIDDIRWNMRHAQK